MKVFLSIDEERILRKRLLPPRPCRERKGKKVFIQGLGCGTVLVVADEKIAYYFSSTKQFSQPSSFMPARIVRSKIKQFKPAFQRSPHSLGITLRFPLDCAAYFTADVAHLFLKREGVPPALGKFLMEHRFIHGQAVSQPRQCAVVVLDRPRRATCSLAQDEG